MAVDDLEMKAQVERLQAAGRDHDLLATIPRVVAAQFGVIPIGRSRSGGGPLEVATVPGITPASLAALARILRREVVQRPFDEGVVTLFLSRLYLKKESLLNFHTFVEEDFLERTANDSLLLEEKEHEPVKPLVFNDPDRIILLDWSYRSTLHALDQRPWSVPFDEEKAAELPMLLAGETGDPDPRPLLARGEPLPSKILIFGRESYSCAGLEHRHGWRTHEVDRLPHMIHPTEVQIVGIEPDGALLLYMYDKVTRVRPGDAPRYEVSYCFLSFGQRLKRKLVLKVHALHHVKRETLRYAGESLAWTPKHLERWLGFDLA